MHMPKARVHPPHTTRCGTVRLKRIQHLKCYYAVTHAYFALNFVGENLDKLGEGEIGFYHFDA